MNKNGLQITGAYLGPIFIYLGPIWGPYLGSLFWHMAHGPWILHKAHGPGSCSLDPT